MCGIAGISYREKQAPSIATLSLLQEALKHRGPDGSGIHCHENVGLVHTRLAIIDLESGKQPITGQCGRTLVMNGEIYNHIELRQLFRKYSYKTQSDCEAILACWEKDGVNSLQYLRGMYAFALYDPRTQDLYVARDPFGIKPLYYVESRDFFAFASEPQGLIKAGLSSCDLNLQAVKELLQLRFSTGSGTPFANIKRLLPGETLHIRHGQIINRFHHDALKTMHMGEVETNVLEDLDIVLSSSVQMHLRSDVPYGLFLSGGVDSSILLSLMHRHHGANFKTYSVGFPGTKQYDERFAAAKMAHSLGVDHVDVDFNADDFWTYLLKAVETHDDPVIDFSALPTLKLAARACQDVKVILSGEGGDEFFGGYRRYQRALRPQVLGGRIWRNKGILDILPYLNFDLHGWQNQIENTILHLKEKKRLTKLQKSQLIDCQHWLPNDLLTKFDRCLMHYGIEGRTPFVDKEVSSFGFFLSDYHKANWYMGKKILRNWLSKHFPISAPYAKKRGFNVPIGEWLAPVSASVTRWLVSQEATTTLMPPNQVHELFNQMKHNKKWILPAWVVLYYVLWHRTHILNKPVEVKEILG